MQFIIKTLSILASLLLAISCLSGYFNPNEYEWFPFLGFTILPLAFINLISLIYWLTSKKFRKLWALLPFTTLLLTPGYILSIYQFSNNEKETNGSEIEIITYNIHNFKSEGNRDSNQEIADYLNKINPDIICFQEYRENVTIPDQQIANLLDSFPYHATSFLNKQTGSNYGLAIYSKYKILNQGEIRFESTTNSSMWVDLFIQNDTIRIFNNHLQTTELTAARKEYELQKFLGKTDGEKQAIWNIIKKLQENFKTRAQQAEIIRTQIDHSPHPVIVCGDFNDTPASFTYHQISKNLTDGFKEAGSGYTYTYKGYYKLLRIDYILYTPIFEGVSYQSPALKWSDHHPVKMTIRPKKEK